MGLRTWVKKRLGMSPVTSSVNLLEASPLAIHVPKRLGIDLSIPDCSWSVARLEALFRHAAASPSSSSLEAARVARHRLSQFWLTAPVDQLEWLYTGPLGDLQRLQLSGPLSHQPLTEDELQWRVSLGERLAQPGQRARLLNLLLALMPYTSPGKFRLANAKSLLPDWLIHDFADHCDPELKLLLDGPAGYLNPSVESAGSPTESVAEVNPALPLLCQRRGEEAMALVTSAENLRKAKALITLHGLAPDDAETLEELSGLRQVLAQLWLDVDAAGLEALYGTAVGQLTYQLIGAGFGSVLVDGADETAREQLKDCAEKVDVAEPAYLGLIFATLLYFPVNKIHFDEVQGLPNWLLEVLGSF